MTPQIQESIRRAWLDPTASVEAIAVTHGYSQAWLHKLARRNGWPRRRTLKASLKSLDMPDAGRICPGLGLCSERRIELSRAWLLARGQMDELEARLASSRQKKSAGEAEQIAKTYAVMVRSLKELASLDAVAASQETTADRLKEGEIDDQDFPDTIDALREELASHLARLDRKRNAS